MISHIVLLFGPLSDQFESRKMVVEMPMDSTVNDVLEHLGVQSKFIKTAINGEIVDGSTQLDGPSEIALLPPVSGG